MKKILLISLMTLLPVMVSAQLTVGIMSPDEVLDSLPETAQIESELESYVQEREGAFEESYQSYIEKMTDYSEQMEAGSMSEDEQASAEEELAELEEELNATQNRIETQIRQRQNDLFSPLLNRVEEAMETVSEELGLDYVINKTASTGDPIVYYASDRGVDITERVIEHLTNN
ncbi:MAG: OmpH family outer membrane protein [Balneolaceae bacterium]